LGDCRWKARAHQVNRMSKKKDKNRKKVSAKKEKYAKFLVGKDERIASRSRVQVRDVPQSLVNENDAQISQQMRRIPRNVEKKDKKKR
jgi:hypothetical protein